MTAPSSELALAHRAEVGLLVGVALDDLRREWQPSGDPYAARDGLAATLPELTGTYGSAAASLGADWYDEMREVADAPGRFRAIPAELPVQAQLSVLVGWATQPLFRPDPDPVLALGNVEAGFQRIVANMDRDTVTGSLRRDPKANGWARQTSGNSCPFCAALAGRGAVYSADTATFSAHNRCRCVAVPVFAGDSRKVQPYVPSPRFKTDKTRAENNRRIRKWTATTP